MPNLALPGNPRYQPKSLMKLFGYDKLALPLIEVELASMYILAMQGVIPAAAWRLGSETLFEQLKSITTTQMDDLERTVTKHDIRALVQLMQVILPEPLRPWVHVPLTSYDVIDTARALLFIRAHTIVVRPSLLRVIHGFQQKALEHVNTPQIGRTHGQHALPITAGFWLATTLSRILYNARKLDDAANELVGKISGAVGAYNAQAGLEIGDHFEEAVLTYLGLHPAPISTQIAPPEPLGYYLASAVFLSAAIAQFGRDCRHLMRTEIGEVSEPFGKDQVGSSTMAHKRNPITFEGLEGGFWKTKNDFGKVLDTLISEHQRDLVGSSVSRDFPTIVVNLVNQLDTLLRPGKDDPRPFIERIVVDKDACRRNVELSGDIILAEPIYLALQMHGYMGDAHHLVNHKAMPLVGRRAKTLVEAVELLAADDTELNAAWERIDYDLRQLFRNPMRYTGRAAGKTMETCKRAEEYLVAHQA